MDPYYAAPLLLALVALLVWARREATRRRRVLDKHRRRMRSPRGGRTTQDSQSMRSDMRAGEDPELMSRDMRNAGTPGKDAKR